MHASRPLLQSGLQYPDTVRRQCKRVSRADRMIREKLRSRERDRYTAFGVVMVQEEEESSSSFFAGCDFQAGDRLQKGRDPAFPAEVTDESLIETVVGNGGNIVSPAFSDPVPGDCRRACVEIIFKGSQAFGAFCMGNPGQRLS